MCSRSAANSRLQHKNRRITATATSNIGSPSETMGIATATIVGDLWEPAMAIALIRNPIRRLPPSPRKIEAGLKVYRKNPVIAPARASVRTRTTSLWSSTATTQVTKLENSADSQPHDEQWRQSDFRNQLEEHDVGVESLIGKLGIYHQAGKHDADRDREAKREQRLVRGRDGMLQDQPEINDQLLQHHRRWREDGGRDISVDGNGLPCDQACKGGRYRQNEHPLGQSQYRPEAAQVDSSDETYGRCALLDHAQCLVASSPQRAISISLRNTEHNSLNCSVSPREKSRGRANGTLMSAMICEGLRPMTSTRSASSTASRILCVTKSTVLR